MSKPISEEKRLPVTETVKLAALKNTTHRLYRRLSPAPSEWQQRMQEMYEARWCVVGGSVER